MMLVINTAIIKCKLQQTLTLISRNTMSRLYKDYDPYTAVTEASFTNMAMSRVLLTAEACYALTFIWNIYYENQKAKETNNFNEQSNGAKADETVYIERKIEVALVAVAYAILFTIGVQVFAVVNQRRYRSGFWLSFATFGLSVLLCVMAFWYGNLMGRAIKADMTDEEKDAVTRIVWSELNYLVVLPIIAALQIGFFTRRPGALFEKKNKVG